MADETKEYELDHAHTQNSGRERNTVDKFYTKDIVARHYCDKIQQYLTIDKVNDFILEPSAGHGAFIPHLQTMCSNTEFLDIYPDSELIRKVDFLTTDYTSIRETYNNIHVIGNPPFGSQSSTAVKFIRHAAKFADSISFILPLSFKKATLQKKVPLYFHCIFEEDVQENAFTLGCGGPDHNVPCVFQIWEKRSVKRIIPPPLSPIGFEFLSLKDGTFQDALRSPADPHASFRRVGINAGEIFYEMSEILSKSKSSHYFIKFTEPPTAELKEKLSRLQFEESNYVVAARSISKQDIIREFNPALNTYD